MHLKIKRSSSVDILRNDVSTENLVTQLGHNNFIFSFSHTMLSLIYLFALCTVVTTLPEVQHVQEREEMVEHSVDTSIECQVKKVECIEIAQHGVCVEQNCENQEYTVPSETCTPTTAVHRYRRTATYSPDDLTIECEFHVKECSIKQYPGRCITVGNRRACEDINFNRDFTAYQCVTEIQVNA